MTPVTFRAHANLPRCRWRLGDTSGTPVFVLQMTQEQFILASRSLHLQRGGCGTAYPAGLYGWRKRCVYFFLLLLLATMIVNLALTVWIMKVTNFSLVSAARSLLSTSGAARLPGEGRISQKQARRGTIWNSERSFAASNCLSETVSRLWSAGSHLGLIKIKGKSQQGSISNKQAEVCHFQGGCARFTPPPP